MVPETAFRPLIALRVIGSGPFRPTGKSYSSSGDLGHWPVVLPQLGAKFPRFPPCTGSQLMHVSSWDWIKAIASHLGIARHGPGRPVGTLNVSSGDLELWMRPNWLAVTLQSFHHALGIKSHTFGAQDWIQTPLFFALDCDYD